MYDFLISEVWWMDTIIASAITAIATIIASIIVYQLKLHKIKEDVAVIKEHKELTREHEKLSKEHDGLSKEHNGLSKEHTGLSKEHDRLSKEHDMIQSQIHKITDISGSIEKILIEEKTKNSFQYDNLTEKQKTIIDSVNVLKSFADELKRSEEVKSKLISENEILKAKNAEMAEQLKEAAKERKHLRNALADLRQERSDEYEPDL